MQFSSYFSTYPHVVIFDTEFTTWEGAKERDWSGADEHRELVQIAAQKIDLKSAAVLDSFERLVKPEINPELSIYFTDLTGITQADVAADGVSFAEAYESFLAWADGLHKLSYSCRETDYTDADVLEENIRLRELSLELPELEFGTLCGVFQAGGIDTTAYNSGKLYQAFGLELGGQEHNAMHDVTSLVESLFALKRRVVTGEKG